MTRRLGQYEITSELGRGAMAVVWRARDLNLDRDVAIKEPTLPAGVDGRTATELAGRFVREARAVAGLNHPGIVTIYNADVADGRPYIAMELIEGGTLSDLVRSGGMPAEQVVSILDQLLDALDHAHSQGIVHRDIKPDNVFVSAKGRVKLADFGIAHVGAGTALTQAGTIMGTPGYMAPEQVVGAPADARADIFAVGVIGYELLTGSNPFGSSEDQATTTIMYRIVHEPLPPVASLAPGTPAWLSSVLHTALAKDPADRYATAEQMRADIEAARAPRVTPGGVPGVTPGGTAPSAASYGGATAPRSPTGLVPAGRTLAIVAGAFVIVVVALLLVFGSGGGSGTGGSLVAATTATSPVASAASLGAPSQSGAQQAAQTAPQAPAADPAGDPEAAVRAYYDDLNARDMSAALEHFSSSARRNMNIKSYSAAFNNYARADISGCDALSDNGSTAAVSLNVYVKSRSTKGSGTWTGTVSLTKEGGEWKITKLGLAGP